MLKLQKLKLKQNIPESESSESSDVQLQQTSRKLPIKRGSGISIESGVSPVKKKGPTSSGKNKMTISAKQSQILVN